MTVPAENVPCFPTIWINGRTVIRGRCLDQLGCLMGSGGIGLSVKILFRGIMLVRYYYPSMTMGLDTVCFNVVATFHIFVKTKPFLFTREMKKGKMHKNPKK